MTQPRSPYRWVIEGALLLVQMAIGVNFLAPAPLFPLIMDEYGLTRATASLLVTISTLIFAATTLPGSILAGRFGLTRSCGIAAVLLSAGALAPLAPNFLTLLALRVAFGLGAGVAMPVTSALVMRYFRAGEIPVVNGVNLAGQGLAVAAAMFLGPPLAEALGWRFPLFLYGAFSLVAALVWIVLGGRGLVSSVAADVPTVAALVSVLRSRVTLLMAVAVLGPFSVSVAFSSWLPTFYNEVRGLSLARSGAIMGIYPLAGVVATLVGGVMPARTSARRPFLVIPGLLFPLAALGTFMVDSLPVVYLSILALGACSWLFLPVLFTIPMETPGMTPEKTAVAIGATLAVGDLLASIAPLFVGALTDALGSYTPAFTAMAFLSLTLAVAGWLLPRVSTTVGKLAPLAVTEVEQPT